MTITTMNSINDATERRIASDLIERILARGYVVSVFDGEAWCLTCSDDAAHIFAALASTGSDHLRVRTKDGAPIGTIVLIWGNGEDLISDTSLGDEIEAICAGAGM